MINYGRQTLNSLDFKEVLKVLKSDYITQGKIINNFEWLSNLVIEESGNVIAGSVIEIACNDGSQLDEFQKRGWKANYFTFK